MNHQSDFVGSVQNNSSATQDENVQANAMDMTQSYTNGLQRENSQYDIMNSRHLNTVGSQEENVQYDPINQTCSESADTNEKGDQCGTVDSKPSHSACSHENGNTNPTDNKLFSTVGQQRMNSQSDVFDNTNSGRTDKGRGQRSPFGSTDAQGEGDDSDITNSKQHDLASSQDENGQTDLLDYKQSRKPNMQEQNGESDISNRKQANTDNSQDQNSYSDIMNNKTSNAVGSQVNNKLDILDNKHSKPSDAQEVSRRFSMGSDLSDAADKQERKYSPSVANQCDSAHTAVSTQKENDQSDLLDNNQSCTANSLEENDESNITNSTLLYVAGSQDENDQSDVFDNNQSCATNNGQEENDRSSITNSKLLNGAGSEEENDKSDLLANKQLCTAYAQDPHIVNQETAIHQPGESERPLNMAVAVNMLHFMLQKRPGEIDVTVNETTVVGNQNTIVQGNPEEHSETLHAISASASQMTDQHEEQTTSLKKEIQRSEWRLNRVIADEGSHIAATVNNVGHDISGRIDETKERVHNMQESVERNQGDMELHIAKSTEAQTKAIEQSVNKTTVNISKEIAKVKAGVSDTKKTLLRAVQEQATVLQIGIVQTSTECIQTAKEDTTEAIESLKKSVDSLRKKQDFIAGKIIALPQTVTNQMAELRTSIKNSNEYHEKAINKVYRQFRELKQKIGNKNEIMEELVSEATFGTNIKPHLQRRLQARSLAVSDVHAESRTEGCECERRRGDAILGGNGGMSALKRYRSSVGPENMEELVSETPFGTLIKQHLQRRLPARRLAVSDLHAESHTDRCECERRRRDAILGGNGSMSALKRLAVSDVHAESRTEGFKCERRRRDAILGGNGSMSALKTLAVSDVHAESRTDRCECERRRRDAILGGNGSMSALKRLAVSDVHAESRTDRCECERRRRDAILGGERGHVCPEKI